MNKLLYLLKLTCLLICFIFPIYSTATTNDEFERLLQAYPDTIKNIEPAYITWQDGSRMLIRRFFPLIDDFFASHHKTDNSIGSITRDDIKNDTLEILFRKMYGNSPKEVSKHLVTIYWMSNLYGKKYPLRVTSINGVDKKLLKISNELEKLPVELHKYVINPASGFYWRNVAKESYLSLHSFGIAIDINVKHSNYWLWDLEKAKRRGEKLYHKNKVPMEIVEIFEKEGFFWGGRWYHYDTMHFEYRPELLIST